MNLRERLSEMFLGKWWQRTLSFLFGSAWSYKEASRIMQEIDEDEKDNA